MQDGMKMGSTESGYQGRDRSGMQGNGAYGEVGREEYGEGGREEYRGRGREQYGYHEIKEHAGRDFPFNIYPCSIPADFRQVPVHWHEDMEIIAVKKGRGVVTVDMEPYEARAGRPWWCFPDSFMASVSAALRRWSMKILFFFLLCLCRLNQTCAPMIFCGP